MNSRTYYVDILTNPRHTVLYTGVTGNLSHRLEEHRSTNGSGFTHRYNVTELVHYETFSEITDAIHREKQIKAGSRKNKIALIERSNPAWTNLM